VTVGFQQPFGPQVTADREQAFGRRVLDTWEAEIPGISAQPNHG
jgi:hypothetical protein